PAPGATTAPAPAPRSSTGADAAKAAEIFQKSLALKRDGKLGPACEGYQQVVELTPQFAMAQYELAQCLRLLGDLDGKALEHLMIAEEQVKRAPIYIEMGRIAEDHGDRDAAMKAYQAASKLAPAEVRAVAGLARLAEKKDGRSSLQKAQQYVDRYPGNIAGWHKLAEIAEAFRKYPLAEEALRKVVELSPNKRAAAAALGAFGQRTRRKKAVEEATRVMRTGR
ncbi:MAG: tetratricopeptide repeat protein, partial [Deltaproteobacteria bacterium]